MAVVVKLVIVNIQNPLWACVFGAFLGAVTFIVASFLVNSRELKEALLVARAKLRKRGKTPPCCESRS
jgi:uncharacterized YccA/Bax inhibitor family protein